ncbi:bile acid:sodium symporter [Leptospira langatensis]|uniref:Bile acid:sodium symporter n=1 Tax=Leptospira langatensis TaxID=2484983 RepID=A0A5F1ZT19_9LEPT|nr:bile acid:sodium symporter [Leptospira langatensis]TGK02763.1 bile acid:sodium symporter [Leptospira langatensis]TGL40032.1 bile acid:sodium symporter [Leptospira langatensis]
MLIRTLLVLLSLSSMLGLGMRIERKEIGSWTQFAPILGFAFLWNFGILPASAFYLGKSLSISEFALISIFLCSASPGGASGGLFVLTAQGNPALGGLLIAILNGANTVLTPLIFSIYQGGDGFSLDLFLKLFMIGFFLQGLPLLVGLGFRYFFSKIADVSSEWVERFSTLCLALSILLLIIQYGEFALSLGPLIWIAAIGTVLVSLSPGLLLFGSERETKASLSMVSGIRSLSLALLLAELHVRQKETLLTILMYGLVMYALAAVFAWVWKERKSA